MPALPSEPAPSRPRAPMNEAERKARALRKERQYGEKPKAVDTKRGIVYVSSRTVPGRIYEVRIANDGAAICNCPAANNHLDCWHSRLVREEIVNTTALALRPVTIAPAKNPLPTEHDISMIDRAAQMAFSGAVTLPAELKTPQQVAAIMLYGWELGLKPMTALRHLYIVNGKVALSAEVMVGMLMGAEPDARFIVERLTDDVCTMRLIRPSRGINETYTVTWQEIKTAGLATQGINSKYPRDRLRYHTVKRLMRIYASDIINNMTEPQVARLTEIATPPPSDELYNDGDEPEREPVVEGDYSERPANVDDDGVMHEEAPPAPSPAATQDSEPVVPPAVLLNQLAKKGPAAKVLAANVSIEDHYPYIKLPNGGRQLTALTPEDAASVSMMLRDWLAERAQPHPADPKYNMDGQFCCGTCERLIPEER